MSGTPRRRPGLTEVLLDGEAVLYDGTYLHHLDAAATAVWVLVDGRRSERAIARMLTKAYRNDRIAADVNALLTTLFDRGLIFR